METKGKSPRARLRSSIPEAYRARGHKINNLWLVYSVKTDKDWLLRSDRQLIHWITFLESNPDVVTFDLAPDPDISFKGREFRGIDITAIVFFHDQHVEWHKIKTNSTPSDTSDYLSPEQEAANELGVIYRIFTDDDLKPNARLAIRLLKAIAFAAVIRDQENIPCRTAIIALLNRKKSGHVRSIVEALENFDPVIIYGVLIRLSMQGIVQLDFSDRSFGVNTRWKLNEH